MKLWLPVTVLVSALAASLVLAEDKPAPAAGGTDASKAEALAKETEAACAASAATKPTPELVIDKVNAACALVEKEGKAAFAKFKGKDSQFIFGGTYIFIIDMEGQTLVQPIKYKLEGTSSIGMKDSKGKPFFVEFIDVCRTQGSGWVDYWWPKAGEKEASMKSSFVKKASCEGKDVVVGCGVYDLTKEDIEKAMATRKAP